MTHNPLVSICCLVYNHRPYIRQCLEGFIMQQCDFEFEVLIHDDASSDGSSEVIKEFQLKYPHVIRPIFQTKNQFSQGIKPTMKYNFPRANGRYIAFCEGDDYWTDPLKLRKQVDFLENNPEVGICGHSTKVEYENHPELGYIRPKAEYLNRLLIQQEIVEMMTINSPTFHTSSFLFRKDLLDVNMIELSSGDFGLLIQLTNFGRHAMVLPEVMSVYRKHDTGLTKYRTGNPVRKYQLHQIPFFTKMDIYTNGKYAKLFAVKIVRGYETLILYYFSKKQYWKSLIFFFRYLKYDEYSAMKFMKYKIYAKVMGKKYSGA